MNRKRTLEEKLWPKVDRSGDCWVWAGALNENGYGRLKDSDGKCWLVHRVSWTLTNGPIPIGLCILHRCDNRPCVRPDHLFLGTRADNNADMRAKGRSSGGRLSRPGELHPMAKLTAADVLQAKEQRSHGRRLEDIAKHFGVSRSQIGAVIRGASWRHLSTTQQGASQ